MCKLNASERIIPFFKLGKWDLIIVGVYSQLLAVYSSGLPRRMVEKMEQLQKLADLVGTLGTITAAIKTPFYFSSKMPLNCQAF